MTRPGPFVHALRTIFTISFVLALIGCGPPRGTAVLTKEDAVQIKESHKALHPPMKQGKKAKAASKGMP